MNLWSGRQVEWVKAPRPPKKTWDELSHQFVEMERKEHERTRPPEIEEH